MLLLIMCRIGVIGSTRKMHAKLLIIRRIWRKARLMAENNWRNDASSLEDCECRRRHKSFGPWIAGTWIEEHTTSSLMCVFLSVAYVVNPWPNQKKKKDGFCFLNAWSLKSNKVAKHLILRGGATLTMGSRNPTKLLKSCLCLR